MKRFLIFLIFLSYFSLGAFLSFVACDKHPVDTPFPPNTPTPTATPIMVNISLSSSLFNPAAVTISAGSELVWTNNDPYPHWVFSSDVSGACLTQNYPLNSQGASATLMYSAPGTCYVHCAFHSACFNTPCNASCEGGTNMTMRVIVQ